MISLTKADETSSIDLSKDTADLVVRAQWTDNGDGSSDNDDMDLRCSILMPDGKMYLVDPAIPGSLDSLPFARHEGDVQSASVDAPGEEVITVARDIAKRAGGPVAVCFYVYSALGNGAVSVASLQPRMTMSCGSQQVVCEYDFRANTDARSTTVYTAILGYAIVHESQVVLAPAGKTSKPNQEETGWLSWKGDALNVDVVGPAVFKGNQHKSRIYNQRAGINRRFANVPEEGGKPGLFKSMFG